MFVFIITTPTPLDATTNAGDAKGCEDENGNRKPKAMERKCG